VQSESPWSVSPNHFLTREQKFDSSVIHLIEKADHSAARLVNILAESFPCFKDDVKFERKKPVRFLKRAQIFVADLWAAFEGEGYGRFDDIDKITMFAGSVSPFSMLPWHLSQ
jgi:Potential Queuosine, Q, salvage protein family